MAPRGRGGYIASMHRTLARALVSATLIAVIGGGGGGLASLDVLLFHRSGVGAEALRAHFEATSACHGDHCTILSTASEPRSAPGLTAAGLPSAPSGDAALLPPRGALHGFVLPPLHFSRAPPTDR